jgi:alkylation response protein AidB-like acyl-CoA dehydrogenase
MDLALSADQRLIVETAEGLLSEASASAKMRAASDSADGIDRALWQRMAELGWCGAHVPEPYGGLGLGHVELALLLEQMGRRLACVPYFDSIAVAATLLCEAADAEARQRWLPLLARGEIVASAALDFHHARATRRADGWVLDGDWPQLGSAATAELLLLPVGRDEPLLLAVERATPGLTVQPLPTIDRTRRAACVQARQVALPAQACIAHGATLVAALERTRNLAAIALAAELLGVARQSLDLTLAYVGQRVQFGRPIATFQAVKHRCAQMMVMVEGARSAVYGAACVADAVPDAATLLFHAALALCEATDAAQCCTQESIQLHGGVGFTWEYDPHLYFKRAQACSQRFGALSAWRERVAAQLLDGDA